MRKIARVFQLVNENNGQNVLKKTYIKTIKKIITTAFIFHEKFQIFKNSLLHRNFVVITDTVLTKKIKFNHITANNYLIFTDVKLLKGTKNLQAQQARWYAVSIYSNFQISFITLCARETYSLSSTFSWSRMCSHRSEQQPTVSAASSTSFSLPARSAN